MAEKQFLRLSEKWALAYDRLQWIIQYRGSAKGKPEKWRGVSFISSNRDILVLTLREKGIVSDPGKMEEVLALPYTFKEWIDQRQAEEDAGARPSEIDEALKQSVAAKTRTAQRISGLFGVRTLPQGPLAPVEYVFEAS